jgi:hypothetical protein
VLFLKFHTFLTSPNLLFSVLPLQTSTTKFPGQLTFVIASSSTLFTSADFIFEANLSFGDGGLRAIADSAGQRNGTGWKYSVYSSENRDIFNGYSGPLSGTICQPLASAVSNVQLYLNDSLITTSNGNYPFISYIKTLTSTTAEEKKYVFPEGIPSEVLSNNAITFQNPK